MDARVSDRDAIEFFKTLWDKLDYPWVSPTRRHAGHFQVEIGDRAAREMIDTTMEKRSRIAGPIRVKAKTTNYRVIIPRNWMDDVVSRGLHVVGRSIVLSLGTLSEKYLKRHGPTAVHSAEYIVCHARKLTVRLAQGTLHVYPGSRIRLVEARYYEMPGG